MLKLVNETPTHYQLEIHTSDDVTDDVVEYHLISKEDLKELFNVINRPLKFEELESGMWVWDSKWGQYIEIYSVRNSEVMYYCTHSYYEECCDFEENRFYRYQPLESEGE